MQKALCIFGPDGRLIDIFNANGIKGTFNLNYGLMDNDDPDADYKRIPKKEITKIYKGHEIA